MRVVELGFSCNNACIFCAQGELRTSDESRAGAATSLVDDLLRDVIHGEIVAFAGGEPTLAERLPEWIRAAHERGAATILVQTNGRRLAYPAYARALHDASPRLALDVSLHGSTEAMHDYHTATPGSFRQTLRGIQNARSLGIRCAVTVVVTRSNFRHLAEIAATAKSAGASAIAFRKAEAFGSAARANDRVIPAWELVKPHLAQAVAESRRLGLGVLLDDAASSSDVRDRFVGIGRVEEVSAGNRAIPVAASSRAEEPVQARRVSLAVLGRPVPGRQEVHSQTRQTGDDLKAIFPSLFEAAERWGVHRDKRGYPPKPPGGAG